MFIPWKIFSGIAVRRNIYKRSHRGPNGSLWFLIYVWETLIFLLKDLSTARIEWPIEINTNALKIVDGLVRKAEVKVTNDGKPINYTRPIPDIILLMHDV